MRSSSNEDLDSTEMRIETSESGSKDILQGILRAKEKGTPDYEIMRHFEIEKKKLREIYNKAYGESLKISDRPKVIRRYQPREFSLETGTVWSFKSRGSWATHDGRYRGNWSPYVPRNLILRYTEPGDTVLDCFVGGGTTAVEAKLLGRRCIARDINPGAIGVTRENLNFSLLAAGLEGEDLPVYEPDVKIGDARDLSDIPDNSVDLVCTHPPYAGIIKYSSGIEGDLSSCSVDEFYDEIGLVAKEILRVLKPGGRCAILIGDTRQSRHVVPIGFNTIRTFQHAGFSLKDVIIKKQHNCKTTGFWYNRSIKLNFLLLAHEYLPIFMKPHGQKEEPHFCQKKPQLGPKGTALPLAIDVPHDFEHETTTVWQTPSSAREYVLRNLSARFARKNGSVSIIEVGSQTPEVTKPVPSPLELLYIKMAHQVDSLQKTREYENNVTDIVDRNLTKMSPRSTLVIECEDVQYDGITYPSAVLLESRLSSISHITLKEIVVVIGNELQEDAYSRDASFDIMHRYLLLYRN